MMLPSDIDPTRDPLYRDVRLKYTTELPVLGVPVRFESNAPAVSAAVEGTYGAWHALEGRDDLLSSERLRVRVIEHPGNEGTDPQPPITTRMPDAGRLVITTPGSVGIADESRKDAVAYVTPDLLSRSECFCQGVLGTLTLFLLTACDRQPLHAAALARGASALLLTGPSGAGKSTLTYAALRSGLLALAEDVVYLQRNPRFRVWGMAQHIRLPVQARAHFPELAHAVPVLLANGKQKIVVSTTSAGTVPSVPVAERAGVCLLARSSGAASVRRLGPSEIEAALTGHFEVGFDRFASRLHTAIQHLGARGGWRLALSDDPTDALPLIGRMLAEVEEG